MPFISQDITQLYQLMGCISENGCLGPRRRDRQVYAELIDLIHQEANKVQYNENLNIYMTVRQKIAKKGYLGKLMDNLSSHRTKIQDCLNLNLRIVTQTQTLETKYAGLVIVNELVVNIYKDKRHQQFNNQEDRTLIKSNKVQNRLITFNDQGVGADIRLDVCFFRIILHLLESEGRMYVHVLDSINNFCDYRQQPIICRTEVWRTLDFILERLQRGSHIKQSSRAYITLLEQLKEGGKQDSTHEKDILSFLRLWMHDKGEDSLVQAAQPSLKSNYQRVIRQFVLRCMSSWESKVLFRTLFVIYQEERFAPGKLQQLEALILGIVLKHDLHSHIIRGLFLYLMEYLSMVPAVVEKGLHRVSMIEEFHNQRYPRVNDKSIKIKGFETLRRWGMRNYIDLDESITFSSSAVVSAYICNMSGDKQQTQEVVRQFFKLTQLLSRPSNLIIINLLMAEIKWEHTSDSVRKTLIYLVREIMEARKILAGPLPDSFSYFLPIEQAFNRETRIEMIQLMGFIVRNLSLVQITMREDSLNTITYSICELFYSLYQGMVMIGTSATHTARFSKQKTEDQEMLYRYQYANAVLSFLKCFNDKCAYNYVLSFLYSLSSKINYNESLAPSSLSLYFELYVLYEGMRQVNPKIKVPPQMANINARITPTLKSVDLKVQMDKFITQLLGSRGQLCEKLNASHQGSLDQLREVVMLTKSEYTQMILAFTSYFKSNQSFGQIQGVNALDNEKSRFRRQSMYGSAGSDSLQERSSRQDYNESFQQIMERIVQN